MAANLQPRPQMPQSNPVTVKYLRREVRMISVAEHELDGLVSPDTSLYLAFFGISSGACLALVITLYTVNISDPIRHATFVGMGWISFAAAIFLAIRVGFAIAATKRKLRELKEDPFQP
jgi:hypothetical protein